MDAFAGAPDQMDLPPGFRFHPTDEELISHYLYNKVVDSKFTARAIGDVDLNKSEPWDLPWKAKQVGGKEWYFFCVRDRKYPTGLRTNRATESGYWKATGKDKEILKGKSLVGMKKTLVFYKGRAPKGEKTNWVMHEYRLEGKSTFQNLPKHAKNEWVICRVFQKNAGGKKLHISEIIKSQELPQSRPLDQSHVPCFSSNDQTLTTPSNSYYFPTQPTGIQYPGSVLLHEQSILRALLENKDDRLKECFARKSEDMNKEISSFDDREAMLGDFDSIWNFPS